MKIIYQISIIFLITAIGEILAYIIDFPVPAGVYGFAILFICLCTGLIKLEYVEKVSDFLLDNMQIFLLPLCAQFADFLPFLQERGLIILVIALATTAVSIGATAKLSDFVITIKERVKT